MLRRLLVLGLLVKASPLRPLAMSRSTDSLHINYSDSITYMSAEQSKAIDDMLMSPLPTGSFSLDTLMELAGYSVACAAHHYYTSRLQPDACDATTTTTTATIVAAAAATAKPKILIMCGPGNNGGDGLVAGRHLKHFGYEIKILLPKKSRGVLFDSLVKQCEDLGIVIATDMQKVETFSYVNLI